MSLIRRPQPWVRSAAIGYFPVRLLASILKESARIGAWGWGAPKASRGLAWGAGAVLICGAGAVFILAIAVPGPVPRFWPETAAGLGAGAAGAACPAKARCAACANWPIWVRVGAS